MASLLATSCDVLPGSSNPTPVATLSPVAVGKLDPQVAMPGGFPADLPVYPTARLVAAASFASGNKTTWGMEWETLDLAAKVQAFYVARLNQGDWKVVFGGAGADGAYSAVISRQSDSAVTGILAINSVSGVTKITLSLVTH